MSEVVTIQQFTGKLGVKQTHKEGCISGEMHLVKEGSQGLLSGYYVPLNPTTSHTFGIIMGCCKESMTRRTQPLAQALSWVFSPPITHV